MQSVLRWSGKYYTGFVENLSWPGQIFLPFCHNARVWRTDRQTDRILIARPRLHCMQRGKNWKYLDVIDTGLHNVIRRRATAAVVVKTCVSNVLTVDNDVLTSSPDLTFSEAMWRPCHVDLHVGVLIECRAVEITINKETQLVRERAFI